MGPVYIYLTLYPLRVWTLAKEDVLWADMAIFIFKLEEARVYLFF